MEKAMNCGQHCGDGGELGHCVLKRGHDGAHVRGSFACETGLRFYAVDQETADSYPPCEVAGIMTAAEVAAFLACVDEAAQ